MIYRFEDVIFDTARRELRRGGVLLPVEPQVFDLLEYLVQNRHRVVSKDELFKSIWRDRIVSDATLSTRINAARMAIGDNGVEQLLIRTLRTKGFRFVGAVREERQSGTAAAQTVAHDRLPPAALVDRPTIMVIPFRKVSGGSEALANGLTEDIVTALAKTDWLLVTACLDTYKRQAIDLSDHHRHGVRYVLDGSVHEAAGRARIAVRLIDGLTNHHLWAEHYDRDIADLFAVLDEITGRVLAAIEPQIYLAESIRAERKTSEQLNSWDCIVRALSLMNTRTRPNIAAAHELLRKAIAIDPKAAKAHALISFITTLSLHQGWARREGAVPLALHAAGDALSLDTEEPWAHLALGYAALWNQPEEALRPLEEALVLDPNLAVGHYLFALALTRSGWPQGVLERADLASQLSARDLLARGNTGVNNNVRASSSFVAGRYQDGIEFARGAIRESPRLAPAYRQLVANCALAGKVEEAKSALQDLKRLVPNISLQWIKDEWQWSRSQDQQRYIEAFRIAGLG